jgi:hypothetical protein
VTRVASIIERLNKNKHARKSDWATDIDGTNSEIACSKYLGIYWLPKINTFHDKPDLINGMDVRSTTHTDGHLILRDNDHPHRRFILVIAKPPIYRLVGSKLGIDGMVERYRQKAFNADEADCWWVKQDDLDDLPEPLFLRRRRALI